MQRKFVFLVALSMFFLVSCASKSNDVSKGKDVGLVVANGRDVTFHYTLSVDGKVLENSKGGIPLMYRHGKQQIIPGLAKQLEGLRVGDKKSVTVKPEEGYGNVNPEAIKEIKRSSLPANSKPEVGMFVEVRSTDGRKFNAKITQVKKDIITLDFNHPLAGKTLNFDIEIVAIN